MKALFEVKDLHVAYGKVEAVKGVSLEIPPGAIVAVIGPNGAGKSTILNAAMGLLPSRGEVAFEGASLSYEGVEARVARGLALVPEKRELFSQMTIADNLTLGAFSRRSQSAAERSGDLQKVYTLFPRLQERKNQRAGTLSGGERQMLAIARMLMSRPKLLMLDEPSLGLAPLIVREVFKTIVELSRSGVSILLVEQNAVAALEISQYAYVLEMGQVTKEGPAATLRKDPELAATYLGLDDKGSGL